MFDTDGNFLGKWDICNCWGIAIKKDGGRDGIMFMTDHANEQVMKVSMKDGKELARWGSQGQQPGQFDWAHDIAVDSRGAVYVSDTYGQKIQKFIDGKVVSLIGGRHHGGEWVTPREFARALSELFLPPNGSR
jgi:tripartite motif-containing protein 2/3/tripartite motif-containing protein 71